MRYDIHLLQYTVLSIIIQKYKYTLIWKFFILMGLKMEEKIPVSYLDSMENYVKVIVTAK